MRRLLLSTCLSAAAVLAGGPTQANDELTKMSQNPKDWVMPTGNYANQRYSKLNQINAQNVGKLQVAWTFSTGVLRGHEGGRSEEHTSELQSQFHLVCRLLLEKKKENRGPRASGPATTPVAAR